MNRRSNLIKSKSIYTIKKKHSVTNDGTIFENDHVTILQNDGIYDDEMALFSDSNFKFKIRKGVEGQKRHVRGGWVSPSSASTVWTKSDVSGHTTTEESKIILKPNYSSLDDFAYYGSAVELIHATINDIIKRFPGGICYYNYDSVETPQVTINGTTYFFVSNEFDIDCFTNGTIDESAVSNPMRVLAASYKNYVNANGEEISCPSCNINGSCINEIIGDATVGGKSFKVYLDENGKKNLVTASHIKGGIIIRPKQEFIDKFWLEADDFERVLLNKNSKPIYTATFNTPYFTNDGYFYNEETYTWPTVDGDFTPDLTSGAFQGYLAKLLSLATFHDSYNSDNIWRMMTHESIKNLDYSFVRKEDGESESVDMDSSRMKAMLQVCARQFDDIKRYTDNIKTCNSVSYDEKNNMPDYFLTDNVEIKGWEAKNVCPRIEESASTSGISSEVNAEFMRRLSLSSSYLHSLKGTKRGIDAIMGLFGYTSSGVTTSTTAAFTYAIEEDVQVAKNFPYYEDIAYLRGKCEYLYDGENEDFLKGLPCRKIEGKTEDDKAYIIPWYSNYDTYNYPFYFQQKGGWGKLADKKINLSITSAKTIECKDEFDLYSETDTYLKYANTIDEMLSIPNSEVSENMVCYVTDISDMFKESGYTYENGDAPQNGENSYSHYFILKNKPLSTRLGYVQVDDLYNCYGWRNIYVEEYNGTEPSEDGTRVLYLESIQTNYNGNNPHTGKGNYDNGESFLTKYNSLFGDALDDGVYDILKDGEDEEQSIYKALTISGFSMDRVVDNKKCHYFEQYDSENKKSTIKGKDKDKNEEEDVDDDFYGNLTNPDGGNFDDEASAFSVMNTKTIKIAFGLGNGGDEARAYIEDVILKYLEPMIPSTAIVSYVYDGKESNYGVGAVRSSAGSLESFTDIHTAYPSKNDKVKYWKANNEDNL